MQPDFYQCEKQNKCNFLILKNLVIQSSWQVIKCHFFWGQSSTRSPCLQTPRHKDWEAWAHIITQNSSCKNYSYGAKASRPEYGCNSFAFILLMRLPLKFLSLSPLCQTHKGVRGKIKLKWTMISHQVLDRCQGLPARTDMKKVIIL